MRKCVDVTATLGNLIPDTGALYRLSTTKISNKSGLKNTTVSTNCDNWNRPRKIAGTVETVWSEVAPLLYVGGLASCCPAHLAQLGVSRVLTLDTERPPAPLPPSIQHRFLQGAPLFQPLLLSFFHPFLVTFKGTDALEFLLPFFLA